MPIYAIACSCGCREDVFCKVSQLDRQNRPKCPKCGKRTKVDLSRTITSQGRSAQIVGNHRFHGKQQRSWEEGWNPKDVAKARAMMGAEGANCIKDDGTVWFKDEQQAKTYKNKINRLHANVNPPERPTKTPEQAARIVEREKREFKQRFEAKFPRGLETE